MIYYAYIKCSTCNIFFRARIDLYTMLFFTSTNNRNTIEQRLQGLLHEATSEAQQVPHRLVPGYLQVVFIWSELIDEILNSEKQKQFHSSKYSQDVVPKEVNIIKAVWDYLQRQEYPHFVDVMYHVELFIQYCKSIGIKENIQKSINFFFFNV